MGISNFSRNGLRTYEHGELVYFLVQPTNISVLSESSVALKIRNLMQLLCVQPDIEIICSDARENFEYNKLSLAKKAEKETNLKVQMLLRRDMKFLDEIQLGMSTSREFMFCYRLKNGGTDQIFALLNRLEKQISDLGFDCKRAGKEDIKRFISRYFGHLCEDSIEDFLIPEVKELTKPLFSIPTHQFLFNAGNINPRDFKDTLQLEDSEFDLIKYPERGTCLFKCGNERYLLQVKAPDYKAKLFGNAGGR